MKAQHAYLVIVTLVTATFSAQTIALSKNGFDLNNSSVAATEIFQGGPPRDGIPSIDKPKFVEADKAHFLGKHDRVLGLMLKGEARAYPIKILNWHEIVNDAISDSRFAITFCPLCGTGMAFDTGPLGPNPDLGVSGLLYQSDVLLYDRSTNSLWSQIMRKAISGPFKGTRLKQLPIAHTSWEAWRTEHPSTKVLSIQTGYDRDYERDPYDSYALSPQLYFEVNHPAPARYHPKEQVLGVELDGQFKAYPFTEISRVGEAKFKDEFASKALTIVWNEEARSAHILNDAGKRMVTTIAFWFAWFTFHPETEVFQHED